MIINNLFQGVLMRHRYFLTMMLLVSIVSFAEAAILRVPQDYSKIQLAINAALPGDTILVSEGTYSENLRIPKKLVLASQYIVDGDTAHISRTIISGAVPSHPDSGSVIHIYGTSDTTTIVKGFTITGGTGTKLGLGTATFKLGGGIYISGGGARISRNIIAGNSLNTNYGTEGGGIALYPQNSAISHWIIEYNIIRNNSVRSTATENYRPWGGGCAIYGGNGVIKNNTVEKNEAYGTYHFGRGGGLHFGGEAGLSSNIRIENNIIKGNTANQIGGGITVWNATTVWNHRYYIYNNIIAKNYAPDGGGGIYTYRRAIIELVNNTIVQNYGSWGSGLLAVTPVSTMSQVYGFNNIFWNHGPFNHDIDGIRWDKLHNNLIRGESSRGKNNIKGDPVFIDTISYRLSPSSPCLGAGTMSASINNVNMTAPPTDLLGNARPRNSFSRPDLGAIEEDDSIGSAPELPRGILHSFSHDGLQRNYVVIPPKFFAGDSGRPVMLHLNCYGCGIDWEMNILELFKYCDTLGFYTVYPEAYDLVWNSGISANSGYPAPSINDVDFILKLIDTLKVKYRIDPNNVFLFGTSNGGFMVQKALAAAGDKFRAVISNVATLTSLMTGGTLASTTAPIMLVNGTSDNQVTYSGGSGFWSIPQTVSWWRNKNKATVLYDSVRINGNSGDGTYTDRMIYNDSTGREMVRYYRITGGGHNYPGGPVIFGSGTVSRDIDIRVEAINFIKRIIVGVDDTPAPLPGTFSLEQNFPNPFNPSTNIRYAIPGSGSQGSAVRISLKVYDILGREVATLVDAEQQPGIYTVKFDAGKYAGGIYICRMAADNTILFTKKMLLVK